MKKYLYFQPEYVSRFQCKGNECLNNCCNRPWEIDIDAACYKKYSRIKPKSKAKEILSHIEYDDAVSKYLVTERPCPFLTKDTMCGIQLEYGEEFLPLTCATYPRRTHRIGNFFERSLSLTCSVAAEQILFAKEPMKFEFVEVPDNIHSKHGRISITTVPISKNDAELAREVQITMISILQERRFTIDQRLIVLGLFLDKLQELVSSSTNSEPVMRLIEIYQSEEFLLTEMPPLFQSFAFDAKKFLMFMMKYIERTFPYLKREGGGKFLNAFKKVLELNPDEKNFVYLPEIIASFEKLTDARKDFSEKYATFLENYLVNELFYDLYPWRFLKESLTKNYAIFLISYKLFELMTFTTVQSGLDSKEDLLAMVDWFMLKTDHNQDLYEKFLELLEGVDDTYLLMTTLL